MKEWHRTCRKGVEMNWNKLRKELETFLAPSLINRIAYNSTGYRFVSDKKTQCYMTVDKIEVFNFKVSVGGVVWHQTEQELKNDLSTQISVRESDIEAVRKNSGGKIPEERLVVIAKNNKVNLAAKSITSAEQDLIKSNFQQRASDYLSMPIEKSLESDDIMLNIFAILDRRMGKKRLATIEQDIQLKHSIVRYFYYLRKRA